MMIAYLATKADAPSETGRRSTRKAAVGMGITSTIDDGIAEVVMDNPPVNALTVGGWFELADLVRVLGADRSVRALVLRAEGKGFNAGVDIKEMQQTDGYDALIGANRG